VVVLPDDMLLKESRTSVLLPGTVELSWARQHGSRWHQQPLLSGAQFRAKTKAVWRVAIATIALLVAVRRYQSHRDF
jgi:hypothetical protein